MNAGEKGIAFCQCFIAQLCSGCAQVKAASSSSAVCRSLAAHSAARDPGLNLRISPLMSRGLWKKAEKSDKCVMYWTKNSVLQLHHQKGIDVVGIVVVTLVFPVTKGLFAAYKQSLVSLLNNLADPFFCTFT